MATIGNRSEIQIVVNAKDETSSTISRVRGEMNSLNSGILNTEISMKSLGSSFLWAAGITAGLGYAVNKIVDSYADFKIEIARAGANVNATSKQLEEMEDIAIKAAKGTKTTATEAANALFFLAGGSVSAKDAMDVLADTIDFATANQIDLRDATLLTSQVMQVFKMRGEDVAKVYDIVTKAGQISYATTEQLSQALQEAGPVSAQLGISFTDLTAIISSMADVGSLGSEAGIALKRALQEMLNPTKQSEEALAMLNISISDVAKLLPTPIELLRLLQERLESYKNPVEKAAILSEVFGQISGPKMAALLQVGVESIDDYVAGLGDVEGATKNASDRIKEAQSPTLKLKEAFEELGFKIAEAAWGN